MANPPAIAVESLSKKYRLGRDHHDTLRDRIVHAFRGPSGGRAPARAVEFWALNDVSFSVARGEAVGIIGRNGAGKSTLLKILSRITDPTRGRATIRGRVASLLEIGTGFHPELTGRENIFLNGAILGMTRTEIRSRFDEIVAFSEVERFLDTPVKHYSSGMHVRLAFAVAAHLDAEILIVDEVLAVGDAQFQKKCLEKVGNVSREDGRTVLFVSHNVSALLNVCQRGIWLRDGCLEQQGAIADVVAAYLQVGNRMEQRFSRESEVPHITSVRLDQAALAAGGIVIHVGFKSPFALKPPIVGVVLSNKLGQPIAGSNGRMAGASWQPPASTEGTVSAQISEPALHTDTYRASVWLADMDNDYDERRDAVEFDFVSRKFYPQSPAVEVIGALDLPWKWTYSSAAPAETADR